MNPSNSNSWMSRSHHSRRRRQVYQPRERQARRQPGHREPRHEPEVHNIHVDPEPAPINQNAESGPEVDPVPVRFHFNHCDLDTVEHIFKRLGELKGQILLVECANGLEEIRNRLGPGARACAMPHQLAASQLESADKPPGMATPEDEEVVFASERKRAHAFLDMFRIAKKIPTPDPPKTVPSSLLGGEKCPECGKAGHGLKQCIWPGPSGLIECCTVCNSKEHYIDECGIFNSFSEAAKYHALITERINMPGVRMATTTWWKYIWPYVKKWDLPFFSMPWTMSFTKQIMEAHYDRSSGDVLHPYTISIGDYSAYLEKGIVMKELLPQDPCVLSPARFARFLRLE